MLPAVPLLPYGLSRGKAILRHAGTAGLFFPTPLRKSTALQGRYGQACRRPTREVPSPCVLPLKRQNVPGAVDANFTYNFNI